MSYILDKQANLRTKKDKVYNLDNFGEATKGKKNIMLVGGYSGAGKSTITNKIKDQYKAGVIELDDLKRMAFGKFDPARTGTSPKYQGLMKDYIKYNPGMKERMSLYGYNTEYRRFNQFVKDYAKSNPNEKIIIEGIQALGDKDMDIPRYLVGTGAIESSQRAKRRAKSLPKGHHYGNPLALNMGMYKKMSKERGAINLAERLKKIEQTNLGPTAKRFLINAARNPAATAVAGGAALGGLGLAGIGTAKTISDYKKKKNQKQGDINKVAMYEGEILKEAGVEDPFNKLTQQALKKTTKTKSVSQEMVDEHLKSQVKATLPDKLV